MRTFDEVFKEVFGETVAHAKAREELYEVEAQEEVVFRSTEDVLKIERRRVMREKINAVQRLFGFYGFIASPLSRKKIAHLICRGKTLDEIYEIGCAVYCEYKKGEVR